MIWGFLMGMIAGAVGVLMFLKHWGETHVEISEIDEEEEKSNDGTGV